MYAVFDGTLAVSLAMLLLFGKGEPWVLSATRRDCELHTWGHHERLAREANRFMRTVDMATRASVHGLTVLPSLRRS